MPFHTPKNFTVELEKCPPPNKKSNNKNNNNAFLSLFLFICAADKKKKAQCLKRVEMRRTMGKDGSPVRDRRNFLPATGEPCLPHATLARTFPRVGRLFTERGLVHI